MLVPRSIHRSSSPDVTFAPFFYRPYPDYPMFHNRATKSSDLLKHQTKKKFISLESRNVENFKMFHSCTSHWWSLTSTTKRSVTRRSSNNARETMPEFFSFSYIIPRYIIFAFYRKVHISHQSHARNSNSLTPSTSWRSYYGAVVWLWHRKFFYQHFFNKHIFLRGFFRSIFLHK